MSKLLRSVLVLSLALNVAVLAAYAHRSHAWSATARASAVEQLDLTAEQQATLSTLQQELRAGARQLKRGAGVILDAMARTLTDPQPDPEQVRFLLEEHAKSRTDLQMTMIDSLLAFRATLDSEQQRAFNRQLERPGFMRDLAGFGISEPSSGAAP